MRLARPNARTEEALASGVVRHGGRTIALASLGIPTAGRDTIRSVAHAAETTARAELRDAHEDAFARGSGRWRELLEQALG